MSKQNNQPNINFIKANMPLVLLGPLLILILLGIGLLYSVEPEILFYIGSVAGILWFIALLFQLRTYKKEIVSLQHTLMEQRERTAKEQQQNAQKWQDAKDKEDFFAMWAHQIKTPIAALNVMLQSEGPDISACRNETFRIESYVEMALNFLRFENMGNDMALEAISLEPLVRTVVKKMAPIFIYKHLSIQLDNLDYQVLTDEKWFAFVLEQILSNSLKYTSAGCITISATADVSGVCLAISDTGIGIRSEDIPRLFEKGFTGYNGRMDKKASGLGLYLCKGICDKLGHSLSISSKENEGTCVKILLKTDALCHNDLVKN